MKIALQLTQLRPWQGKESWRGGCSNGGERPSYGKDYIIPSTFDPRLISVIPVAVAKVLWKLV